MLKLMSTVEKEKPGRTRLGKSGVTGVTEDKGRIKQRKQELSKNSKEWKETVLEKIDSTQAEECWRQRKQLVQRPKDQRVPHVCE